MTTATPRFNFWNPDNRGRVLSVPQCAMCMKPVKGAYRVVHVVMGGAAVLHPADEALYVSDNGDLGAHPIGPDCARKLGLEWSAP